MNLYEPERKRNPNLTSFVRKSHNFCDAKAYALYHVYPGMCTASRGDRGQL